MKQLRQFSLAAVVVCLLAFNTFAGEMNCPLNRNGEMNCPITYSHEHSENAVQVAIEDSGANLVAQNSTNPSENLLSDLWFDILRVALQGVLTIF